MSDLQTKKTYKTKSSFSETSVLIESTIRILEREKNFGCFWSDQKGEISQKLWLPTKTDSTKTICTPYSRTFTPSNHETTTPYKPNKMGNSWFSIEKKYSNGIQAPSPQFVESLDSEVTEAKIKTIKISLFPKGEEKEKLKTICDISRWYYNISLNALYLEKDRTGKETKDLILGLRDKILPKYKYTKSKEGKELTYNENNNSLPVFSDEKIHNRIPRGSIIKLQTAFKSANTNMKRGNVKSFELHPKKKKDLIESAYFEDSSFPILLRNIDSVYFFRKENGKNRRREKVTFQDIFESTKKRGVELIYDKLKNRFFLHYPVETSWYPENDIRIDSQERVLSRGSMVSSGEKKERIISLDPGIRKFMVGYDPGGKIIVFGEGASKIITEKLLCIDRLEKKESSGTEKLLLWRKIKDMVSEMHNKSISFLVSNYDTIILPEFRTQSMMKSKTLLKIVKRIMGMFSFYKFKEKLKWKASVLGKKVIIVDESYTSKTCGNCGVLNYNLGSSETFECKCGFCVDRDVNGARNILIKNTLRLREIVISHDLK